MPVRSVPTVSDRERNTGTTTSSVGDPPGVRMCHAHAQTERIYKFHISRNKRVGDTCDGLAHTRYEFCTHRSRPIRDDSKQT